MKASDVQNRLIELIHEVQLTIARGEAVQREFQEVRKELQQFLDEKRLLTRKQETRQGIGSSG